jgi:ribosomal protein RSM22 (predicted rRNA methylase)
MLIYLCIRKINKITVKIEELKNESRRVASRPYRESSTEHWLFDFLKDKILLDAFIHK